MSTFPRALCYIILLLVEITYIHETSYEDLMSPAEAPTMLTRRVRVILLEVFKSINMFISDCLNAMFKIKDGNYSFRNTRKLLQPKKRKPHLG